MFTNRAQAAIRLVEKLGKFGQKDTIILAIPRGAVGMGKIIAELLETQLDVVVVRKIGAPTNPELAIGAVGPDSTVYWDESLCRRLHIDKRVKNEKLRVKSEERAEREKLLRGRKRQPVLKNKVVIVVDDGVATGATSIAAALFVQKKKAKKIILATPVIATDTLKKLRRYFDEVVYLEAPDKFLAVGQFYEDFPQVSDEEVRKLLN